MELVRPAPEHEAAYLDYLAEWPEEEGMSPYMGRLRGQTYARWLESLREMECADNCPEGLVPATTLLLMENGEILGAIDIRHYLNDNLRVMGGHIGYGVRPSKRRRGYATEMLRLALPAAKALGIDRALLTCDKDNTASAKVIKACGGVLENEIEYEGTTRQRYWIEL